MTARPTRLLTGILAGAATLAVLAGCSDPATPAPNPTAAPAPALSGTTGDHNSADVMFVQGMIPHHRQAIDMSRLADQRAASPELKELAGRISAAQGPEIDRMNRMLSSWDVAPGAMGGMTGMSGMMSPDQMRGLEVASGPAFDRAFLEMMIQHHTGAVEMARTELAQGQNPEAKQLAAAITDAQRSEIVQMRSMLGRP